MGRRSGGGSSGGFGRRPSPSAPSRNLPARAPPAAPAPAPAVAAAAPRQPGLMAQMASTAVGVGVGSAIGHTVGAAITGRMGGDHSEAAPAPQDNGYAQQQPAFQQQQLSQQQNGGVCGMEMKQFLECAQNQYDLSLCSGFSEALKSCRMSNGLQQ